MSHFMFDFDETLVKGDIIEYVSNIMYSKSLINKIYTGKDLIDFNLSGLPINLKNEVIKAFSDPECVSIKKAIPEAYQFLCTLHTNKHDISILTARPQTVKNETIVTWIKEFPGINIKHFIFSNKDNDVKFGLDMPNKKEYLSNIMPDYYFDDSIEYCNMAAELKIKTYLISNKYTGWNNNKSLLHKDVIVLKCVNRFPEKI